MLPCRAVAGGGCSSARASTGASSRILPWTRSWIRLWGGSWLASCSVYDRFRLAVVVGAVVGGAARNAVVVAVVLVVAVVVVVGTGTEGPVMA